MTPQQRQDRLDDLAWMYVGGECAAGAAQRLGIQEKHLDKWARRHCPNLWRRLMARNPIPIDKVQAEKVAEQHARWVRESAQIRYRTGETQRPAAYNEGNETAPRRCVNTVGPRGLADYQGVD